VQDAPGEDLHGFPRVQLTEGREQRLDLGLSSVPLEHPVGDEGEPVTGQQLNVLQPIGTAGIHTEDEVRLERQRQRALRSLVQVAVAAVGDDDVPEGVGGSCDVCAGLWVRRIRSSISSTPRASPRSLTGAYSQTPCSLACCCTCWLRSARPATVVSTDTGPGPRSGSGSQAPGRGSRVRLTPLMSRMRKLTSRASTASASCGASASTPAAGGAASAAARSDRRSRPERSS